MLTENDIKEELSYAYVHAVASLAGFSCENVRKDRDSIDLHVCARGRLHPESRLMSPQIAIQVKASVLEPVPDAAFDFRLTLKNYDDLRQITMIPRLLVVFAMPSSSDDWHSLSEEALVLRKCAYWRSLRGAPASLNEKYQVIRVSREKVLTVDALRGLMVRASRDEEIDHDG
jgi:hypothetical protein